MNKAWVLYFPNNGCICNSQSNPDVLIELHDNVWVLSFPVPSLVMTSEYRIKVSQENTNQGNYFLEKRKVTY